MLITSTFNSVNEKLNQTIYIFKLNGIYKPAYISQCVKYINFILKMSKISICNIICVIIY